MLQKPRLKPPILQKQPLRRSIYTAFNVVLWMVRYSPVRKQSHGNKNSQSESRFGMVLVKWTIWCHFYDRKEYRPWTTVVDLLNSLTKEIHVKKKMKTYLRLNCFSMTLNRKSLPLEHSFWLTSVFTQTGRWSFYLCYYWCCVTGLLKTLIPVSILHWLGVFSRRTWNCAKSACLFYRVNLETANFLNSNTDSNYLCFR